MIKNLNSLCDEFNNDTNILSILKHPILEALSSTNQTSSIPAELILNLTDHFNNNFIELINSVELIIKKYPDIYFLNAELFDSIIKRATTYKIANECWLAMNEDKDLSSGISRMVALWLTSDYSQVEKDTYHKIIMKEIYNNNVLDLLTTINLIKCNYSIIYQFNQNFFNELEQHCKCKQQNDVSLDFKNNKFSHKFKKIFSNK